MRLKLFAARLSVGPEVYAMRVTIWQARQVNVLSYESSLAYSQSRRRYSRDGRSLSRQPSTGQWCHDQLVR
jgi:hypothetical protein